METSKKVLCTTDFSEESERAFSVAIELAKALNAEIHVFHAYPIPMIAAPEGGVIATPQMLAQLDDAAQTHMQNLVGKWRQEGVELIPHISQGPAARLIVETAVDLGANFIVVGTHGRTGLGHLLIGSVAERVVRTSPIPVISVRTTDSTTAD